jgi:hypothetical protein
LYKELNSSVRKHSKKQLEIKLQYPLDEKLKKTAFQLNFYFFFPSQLHVTEKRIGVANFLNNMLINTRFSSPLMPLERVLDTDFHLSPLIRIENLLTLNKIEDKEIQDRLLYELQTLCNLYRAETRNFVKLMKKEIKKNMPDEIYRIRILNMLQTIEEFLTEFRKLHTKFLDPHIHEDQRTALNWADESISIITENGLISLYKDCQSLKESDEILKLMEIQINSEIQYRESMNYKYQFNEENPLCGETMAYRESILKKWSQSAMYMDNENSQAPRRIGHLIAGTAAATAMFFALFVAIYAESFFPRNSTLWILIIVLSYVFKDRIKEILRESFGNMMPKLTTDQQSNLFDPAHKTKVGKSSGTIRFRSLSSIPSAIHRIRFKNPNPFRRILPPNDVIHYKRVVKIKPALLKKNHSRLEAITEILRFQIDPWLKEMDDTKDMIFRLENKEKIPIKGSRLYRVHLIIGLKEQKRKKESFYHYNLNLNKSGIVRIKKVET